MPFTWSGYSSRAWNSVITNARGAPDCGGVYCSSWLFVTTEFWPFVSSWNTIFHVSIDPTASTVWNVSEGAGSSLKTRQQLLRSSNSFLLQNQSFITVFTIWPYLEPVKSSALISLLQVDCFWVIKICFSHYNEIPIYSFLADKGFEHNSKIFKLGLWTWDRWNWNLKFRNTVGGHPMHYVPTVPQHILEHKK